MALIWLSLAWIGGIAIATRLVPQPYWCLICLVPVPLLLAARLRTAAFWAILVSLVFCGGAFFQNYNAANHQGNAVSAFNDSYVTLKGSVARQPEERDQNTRLRIEIEQIELDGTWQATSGAVAVYVERYPAFEYGDDLEINGFLETPAPLEDFDYAGYLARQDIYSVMYYPQILLTGPKSTMDIQSLIIGVRSRLSQSLTTILPEPQASLAQALLLGMRSTIPNDVRVEFNTAGIAHILAISGMHIAIVTGLMTAAFQRLLGKRHYLYIWLALAFLWLYAFVAGASPSVVRAAIMASIYLLAELTGRQKNVGPALLLAASIMLAANPRVLYEVSFQLSVLAMLGLTYIFPLLRPSGEALSNWSNRTLKLPLSFSRLVMDGFWLSVAASLAVWPVTAWHFGSVAMLAPLSTVLAIPALPAVIVLAAGSAVAGIIWWPFGQIIGWLAWLGLSYLLALAHFFAGFRWAAIQGVQTGFPFILTYYVLLAGLVALVKYLRTKGKFRLAGLNT